MRAVEEPSRRKAAGAPAPDRRPASQHRRQPTVPHPACAVPVLWLVTRTTRDGLHRAPAWAAAAAAAMEAAGPLDISCRRVSAPPLPPSSYQNTARAASSSRAVAEGQRPRTNRCERSGFIVARTWKHARQSERCLKKHAQPAKGQLMAHAAAAPACRQLTTTSRLLSRLHLLLLCMLAMCCRCCGCPSPPACLMPWRWRSLPYSAAGDQCCAAAAGQGCHPLKPVARSCRSWL